MDSNESHAARMAVYLPASTPGVYLEDTCVPMPLAALPHPTRRQLMIEARARLRQMWAEGVHFFSKSALEDIIQQMGEGIAAANNAEEQKAVAVKGLDGTVVEFPLEMGRVYPWEYGDDDIFICVLKPCLLYQTAAHLIEAATIDERAFHPLRAYLPLEVTHWTEKCDAFTHVPVPAVFPTIPREAAQAPPRAQPLCGVSLRRSSDTGSRSLEQRAPQRGRV